MVKAYTIVKRVDKQNGELFIIKFYSERTIQSRKLQREVDTKGKVGRDCNSSECWRETESVYHRMCPHFQVSDSPLTVISAQLD